MAENSDGAKGAVDEGGGCHRDGVAETAGIDAPRQVVGVRNFPRSNSTGNNKVASKSGQGVENTPISANEDSEMIDQPSEVVETAVMDTGSPVGGRKRLPAHERRNTPPKKANSAQLDPIKFAEETNELPDKVYNSILRARLELVPMKSRMAYYDALDKQKRIRTIGECSGIMAVLTCPGIEAKYGVEKRHCGKKGTLKPNGRTALTQGQKRQGKTQHRVFYCPKPRPISKNGNPGMGASRTGCGRSISSFNLWNLAVEARDEIRNYLETNRLLSQTGFEDPGKIDTAEKRSYNRAMIAKGRTPAAAKKRTQTRPIRSRGKMPSTPELYMSDEEDYFEPSGEDEEANQLAQRKLRAVLDDSEDGEKSPSSPPLQQRYATRANSRARKAASAATNAYPALETIDVEMTQIDAPTTTAAAPKTVPTTSKAGPSNAKKAAIAQLKVALKSPKVSNPAKVISGGNIIPSSEQEEEIPFFDVPQPNAPILPGDAGGLLSPKTQKEKRNAMANLAIEAAEQAIWDKYSPPQQFHLYKDMKNIITKQAESIDKLIKRDEEKTAELDALRKRDDENSAKMTLMQEQISVISERLVGTVPTRNPTPVEPPPVEIEDDEDSNGEFVFPPLPSGRQAVPQRAVSRRQARPPPLSPGVDLPKGVEPDWVQIVKRGRKITRGEVGDAHIAKIAAVKEKLEKIRAKAARRTAKTRQLREYSVLYFSGKGRIQHWQMKKLIQEAMFVKDRGVPIPLVFVSFIGGSIMEVLVEKKQAAKARAVIQALGHSYLKKGIDPFSRLVRKPTANGPTNVALTNARKCKERSEIILRKFAGPEVIDYYTRLLEQADEIIEKEVAKEAAESSPAANDTANNPALNEKETHQDESPEKEIETTENREAPPAATAASAPSSPRIVSTPNSHQNEDNIAEAEIKPAESEPPSKSADTDKMEIELPLATQQPSPRNTEGDEIAQ